MKNNPHIKKSQNQQFWHLVHQNLVANKPVAVTFVVAHTNHSPGTAGARLLLVSDEDPWGTIGGGIMEKKLLERMQAWLDDEHFAPFYETLVHQKNTGKIASGIPSGLICAGRQTNLYFRFTALKDLKVVQQIILMIDNGKEAMWRLNQTGLSVLEDNFKAEHNLFIEGKSWLYQEQFYNPKQVLIVGGGHCALALSALLFTLGYAVVVVDTRPEVHTAKQLSSAQFIVIDSYKNAGEWIKYPAITSVIIMTAGAKTDVEALQGLVTFKVPFIGVMGSLSKRKFIYTELKSIGVTANQLNKITAPVGLDIGSNTPEEIAVSIAGQLIRRRNLGTS